jgi:hypothetical protein
MPANFGEIANYHSRLAAQHMALAREARDAGDLNAAEYNRQIAARYIEAAEEQKTVMSQAPGYSSVNPAPRPWAQQEKPAPKPAPKPALKTTPRRAPFTVNCLAVLRRGADSVAATLNQSLSNANASLRSLSLHDTPPAPAPQLRG